MSKMNAVELAARLNGREYRKEITKEECAIAKENGLVVVFGASDDLLEFRGAIYEELGAYNGTTAHVFNGKVVSNGELEEDLTVLRKYGLAVNTRKVKAYWCPASLDASWLIESDESASFDVLEDGELYCRGIVFSLEGDRP